MSACAGDRAPLQRQTRGWPAMATDADYAAGVCGSDGRHGRLSRPAGRRRCGGRGQRQDPDRLDRGGEPGQPAPRDVPGKRRSRRRLGGRRRRSTRLGDRRDDREEARAEAEDDARLPRDARRQEHRRRRHRHARPLARPAGDPRRDGRQGRVRREAGRAQRRRGAGDDPGGAEVQQGHGRRHPAAELDPLPEGRRGRPLGQARQGLLGPDLELREHQPGRHGGLSRHGAAGARRLRPLARPRAGAGVQPEPVPPPVPLVLRLRRRHDERLGRPPERHRALGTRRRRRRSRSTPPAASSPPTTTATRPTRFRSSTNSPAAPSPTRCARGTA